MRAPDGFRPIPSCPGYFVNASGHVLSLRRGGPRLITRHVNSKGYLHVGLFVDGRLITRTVHVLVAEAFHGPRPAGLVVRHLDGQALNVHPNNLAYGTPSENVQDEVRHGTHAAAARTHCPQNHVYDAANTHVRANGHRQCRRCQADRTARSYARTRQTTGGTR